VARTDGLWGGGALAGWGGLGEIVDTLQVTWFMPGGSLGRDNAPENPLSRAAVQLLQRGKSFPRLSMCFFDTGNGVLRWLGVIVHSAGDRILFFPGYSTTPTEIRRFMAGNQVWNQPFLFDHASLQSDLRTWHATTPGSADHLGKLRTLDLGESRVLWFGLSVADENALRLLCEETVVTATVPASDGQRRIDAFMASRDGAQFPLVSLNTEQAKRTDQAFLHFAFVVGPRGFPEYSGPELGAPFNSPFLAQPLPGVFYNLLVRSHRIELSPTIDLQITCCQLPGSLTAPITFTGPSNTPNL
jgi:hypothetical protein